MRQHKNRNISVREELVSKAAKPDANNTIGENIVKVFEANHISSPMKRLNCTYLRSAHN